MACPTPTRAGSSHNGQYVGWNSSGTVGGAVTDIYKNNAAGMWQVLLDQGIKGIGLTT
ncbi:MAG: hypothetical protein U1E70_08560 [Acetobacteraceae bacterium]|nr:hypothetical protein [Pseudomonadota bacterium]